MNKFKNLLYLSIFLLHLFTGCSSSDNGTDEPPIPPDGVGNEVVVYEANPGLFGNSGALNAISGRLEAIQALGANVVWLMPIYEQGVLNAIGSPYSVKDYKAVNAEFGTLADLKALVTKAHSLNMRVILDWVGNHTSWDNAWIVNKSWYTQDAAGNIVSPPGMGWNDVADLNYGNTDMRAAMLDAMKYWITEADIDGYRCDYAEGVPDDFWTTAITELRTLKGNDLLMLAESGNASYFAAGFDMVYAWDFAYRLRDVYAGTSTVSNLYNTHSAEYQGVPEGKQRMRYTTNHDMASEQSPIQSFNGEQGALSAFVIAATMPGSPMIYSSQEIGYSTPLSFFNHVALDWNSNPNYTRQYQNIMSIYNASDALKKGTLATYENGSVATFSRRSQNQTVLVMVNTTNSAVQSKVPISFAYTDATNLLDNTSSTLPSVLTMQPYQFFIWEVE